MAWTSWFMAFGECICTFLLGFYLTVGVWRVKGMLVQVQGLCRDFQKSVNPWNYEQHLGCCVLKNHLYDSLKTVPPKNISRTVKTLKLILFISRENISKRWWKTIASSLEDDLLSRIFFNLQGIQRFYLEIGVSYFPVHNILLQVWLERNLSRKAAGTSQVSSRHPVDLGSPYLTLESGTGMSDATRGKFFPCFFIPPASEMPLCCSSKYLMNNLPTAPWGLHDNKDLGFDFKEFI